MPLVYRAPMRSRRDDVDPALAVERALSVAVCGVGGRLSRKPSGLEEALELTEQEYDVRTARRLERFAEVSSGSFVWTRDADGDYLLGRITGEWRYDEDADALAADLVHVRDCVWMSDPVSYAEVPPAVVLTFARGGRNFQQIREPAVGPGTEALWQVVSGGLHLPAVDRDRVDHEHVQGDHHDRPQRVGRDEGQVHD